MTQLGDVIIAARKAAAMTQDELRDRLGVTQATLSRYENDLREPDPDTLHRLSDALGLSLEFLTHEFKLRGGLGVDAHMRRQKSAKTSDWRRIEARLNLLRMHSSFLLARVPMNTQVQVPTFDPVEAKPAEAARMVRAQWKLPMGPVRDLTRWVESAGVIVVEEDFGTRRIDAMSQWAGEFPVVLMNRSLTPARRRLTLAHELGHLVLHNEWADEDMEQQANEFAAEFMMPEHVIKPELRKLTLGKIVDLKVEWGISMAAIIERAYRFNRLSGNDRQSFYRLMNARGWRTHEPAEDKVQNETPRLVRSIGESLRGAGLNDVEIAKMAGFNESRKDHWFAPRTAGLRLVEA